MALNFPSSPTIGQVYTDSTSGFSYEWDGTVWRSFSASISSNIRKLDDISGSFNGITTSFSITSNSTAITPPSSQSLIVNLGGVIQDPSDDYSVSGSNLIFSTAPLNGLSFSGVSLGPAIPINTIPDGTVTDGSLTVSNNLNVVGLVTASAFVGDGSGLTGVGIGSTGSVNTTGIITATAFVGDGSGLTGAGSTVGIDTTTDSTFYPLFTQTTSGTVTSTSVADSKLTFNPSLGRLTATIVNSSSDENLKKDITTIENALEKVNQLRGVNFTWKDTDEKSKGVIAQELQKVFPELVSEDSNGLSINYSGLIGVLIEAIKELQYKSK
jgi:hypothetical protein